MKEQVIAAIKANIAERPNFYIVDIAGLNAEDTAKLRRDCFNEGIKLTVVKNTLLHKVIKDAQNPEMELLVPALEGNTALMYTEAPAVPAKLIKKYNKAGSEKPALKAAYVQECAFVGADKSLSTSSPARNSSARSSECSRALSRTLSALCRMVAEAPSPASSRPSKKKKTNNNQQFNNFQLWQTLRNSLRNL